MDWKKMQLKRHALTGISYMIPVVVAGGGCGPCCADCQKTVYRCNFSYRIQIKATSNPYNSLNPLTWSESP